MNPGTFGIGRTAGLEGKGIIRIFGVYGPDIVRVDSVEKGTEELDRPEKGENFPVPTSNRISS